MEVISVCWRHLIISYTLYIFIGYVSVLFIIYFLSASKNDSRQLILIIIILTCFFQRCSRFFFLIQQSSIHKWEWKLPCSCSHGSFQIMCFAEVNIMWAGHQTHHSSEGYNLSTALRQSVFQVYTSWVSLQNWIHVII